MQAVAVAVVLPYLIHFDSARFELVGCGDGLVGGSRAVEKGRLGRAADILLILIRRSVVAGHAVIVGVICLIGNDLFDIVFYCVLLTVPASVAAGVDVYGQVLKCDAVSPLIVIRLVVGLQSDRVVSIIAGLRDVGIVIQ